MDHRKDARFPVQFRSSFSSANSVSGTGILKDLSIRGCRIFSQTPVKSGTEIELRIEVSPEKSPIHIQRAVVRWSRDEIFGLEFMNLANSEWAKLRASVHELGKESGPQEEREDSAV